MIDGYDRNVQGETTFGENFIEWRLKESSVIRSYVLERNGLILTKGFTQTKPQGGIRNSSYKDHKCNRVDGL